MKRPSYSLVHGWSETTGTHYVDVDRTNRDGVKRARFLLLKVPSFFDLYVRDQGGDWRYIGRRVKAEIWPDFEAFLVRALTAGTTSTKQLHCWRRP